MKRYPLAPNGIFRSIQGEGALTGVPMTFLRLAGCSIGCPKCDTDYRVNERVPIDELVERVAIKAGDWIWITGGEPTDHDLGPLIDALRLQGARVAVATAGHGHFVWRSVDWLSVSPHNPKLWIQEWGHELKLVPRLNGFSLLDFDPEISVRRLRFNHYFVSPCDGDNSTVAECIEWVETHQGWRMTQQAHKQWGLA